MKPAAGRIPTTIIHYIPNGSTINAMSDYWVNVTSARVTAKGISGDIMQVRENDWYDEENPAQVKTLPWATCLADIGCSIGVTAKQRVFLSDPLESVARSATAGGYTLVFSVRQLSDSMWIGSLGAFGSSDSVTTVMEKDNVNPGQPINFSIVSGNWGNTPGQNLFVTAKADLTSGDSALHYTITGTSSVAVPSVSVIPRIYKQTPEGDIMVFTGPAQTCPSGKTCTVHGDFVPVWDVSNITSMFFANTTVVFTLPSTGVGAGGLTSVGLQPPETGSALTVPEVVVTEPLVPQKPGVGKQSTDEGYVIPWNGTVDHTMKNGEAVTAVFDPDGQPISWTEDSKATKIPVPGNRELPATAVFIIPSESIVNQYSQQNVIVTDPSRRDPVISIKQEGASASTTLPTSSGVYYIGKGGSVTSTAGNNVFMTSPIGDTSKNSRSTEPSFKHMRQDFGNGQSIEILCNGLDENLECTGIVGKNQETKSVLSQPDTLNFSIISGASPNAPEDVDFSAESVAYNEGNILHYTIVGKSSQTLSRIEVTPLIFTLQTGGPNLSFKGIPVVCLNSDTCTVSGTFEMNRSGTYYAHGYLDYTTPISMTIQGSPEHFYLTPDSNFIYYSNSPAVMPRGDNTIHQIDGKDIYLWGYAAGEENLTATDLSALNFIVYNVKGSTFAARVPINVPNWGNAAGLTGNGYAGKSRDTMSWRASASVFPPNAQQMEKGGYFQERYHTEIYDGERSSSLGNKDWAFGNCHYEHFDCPKWPDLRSCNHWVKLNGFDKGREELFNDYSAAGLIKTTKTIIFLNTAPTGCETGAGPCSDGYVWILESGW